MNLEQKAFSMNVGDRLQLQKTPSDRPERYLVRLVGYLAGQSLIVTTPQVNGKVAIIRPDQRYAVRVLQGSSVFGFVSSVLQTYSAPFPHLHLSYPRDMESIVVRNALRAATDIPAYVRNNKRVDKADQHRAVRVVDISHTGARLVSEGPLGQEGDLLTLLISLSVCGMDENLGLICEVRCMGRRQLDDDPLQFWTGVQFQSINRFQKVLIHAFVMERLAGETTRLKD